MKKWDGLVGRMLSGMALMGLMMLSLFASQAIAFTDVYTVKPTTASNSGTANALWQTFVATCDSIDSVTYFVGAEATDTTANYLVSITDSATSQEVWSASRSARGWKYQDMGFGVHKPVTRGKTYYLRMSISAQYQQTWNYFYDSSNPYTWGVLGTAVFGPQGGNDLAARVVGSGRVLDQWGMNLYGYDKGGNLNLSSLGDRMNDMGVNRERDQLILGVKDASDAVWIWRKANPCSIDWYDLNRIADTMARKGIEVVFNPLGSPWNWSCVDTTLDTQHRWIAREWRMMLYPPKNLRKPVRSGNDVDTSNYYAKFLYELVRRYGPTGTARNGQPTGTFWVNHSPYRPVRLWEIENEMNWHVAWAVPGYETVWDSMGQYFPNCDYNTRDDSTQFIGGNASRQLYWLNLYLRQLAVADTVIHYLLYPNNGTDSVKILTNSLSEVNRKRRTQDANQAKGKEWLKKFYEQGGKAYSDGITYHAYQGDDEALWRLHGFRPHLYKMDFDSIRAVMKANRDTGKCWMDEQGWGTTTTYFDSSGYFVGPNKQADCVMQMYTVGTSFGSSPYGPLNWEALYLVFDYDANENPIWTSNAGVVKQAPDFTVKKPSYYAFKQANTKLKSLYFNRQVPLGNPSDSVYCYEFQVPGSDTMPKTWVIWRSGPYLPLFRESLAIRTSQYDSVAIDYNGNPRAVRIPFNNPSGRINPLWVDSVPQYITEVSPISRPDVVVDSVWIVPDTARAGEGLRFYARIRNIGNDSLKASIPDTVTFQVDGVTKIKYRASRGLAPFRTPRDTLDTLTVGYIGVAPVPDWYATWGDHLIKAWADSSDKYVELQEDNNMGYLFKHMKPTGTVTIPGTGYGNGRKFSKVRPVNLSLLSNGGVAPLAQKMRIKNSWETNWRAWRNYATSWWDTLPNTGDGPYSLQARFKMANGESSATVVDSIILDMTVPNAWISSPAHGATISGSVPFYGQAHDFGGYFRFDTLKYHQQTTHQHDTIHVSLFPIGEMMPALLGTWNTNTVTNGLTRETLAVYDSAGNVKKDSITLTVYNNSSTDGGANWATGFGTYTSPVMNVATDPAGNVYFAETQNSKIRKYSPRKDSLFAFSAKRGQDSTGTNWAVSMALKDSTTLYIVDGYAHCTEAFDRQGNLLLRFGSFGSGPGQFKQPCGIALDHKGRVFVVDRLNHRVQVFSDTSGAFLFQFGSQGQDSGKFNSPTGIAITLKDILLGIAQDLIWVSDTKNNQIQVFDSLGNYLKTIKQPDTLGFDTPTGICADKWGDVYVADTKHNRIVELNPYGQRILDFGGLGDSLWQFRNPIGVATSPGAHYLYVADMGNRRVQRFTVILEDSSGGGPQSGGIVQRVPLVYSLAQSHPNPTTGEALIEYGLPKESPVRLTVYNVAGQAVREYKPGKQDAGFYTYKWDGRSNLGHRVGAGVYFYRLTAGNWVKTRKMVVVR